MTDVPYQRVERTEELLAELSEENKPDFVTFYGDEVRFVWDGPEADE